MKFRFVKALLCLAFATVVAGAWDLHMLGSAHEAGESCQVCAVASAPELNADCGSDLLAVPLNFIGAVPALSQPMPAAVSSTVFSPRAPPLL
ncbi:MAG TPA: hypothetical protein PKI19_08640 [Elusimicrobiales bacterium]|nr:hypothetical protein [Elusimicrobiales bacterium]